MTDRSHSADVLVIGSGIAGLSLALRLAPRARIAVVTKGPLKEGATFYAQGGISAVLDKSDSIASHIEDTLDAGYQAMAADTQREAEAQAWSDALIQDANP